MLTYLYVYKLCTFVKSFQHQKGIKAFFIDSGGLLISTQTFQNWKLLRSVLLSWHPTKINEFIGGLTQDSYQIHFSSCIIFSGHSLSNSRHIENILIFTKCANKSFECCCIEQVWTLKIDSGKWRIQNFSTQAMPGSPCRTLFFVTRTCCWLFFSPLVSARTPRSFSEKVEDIVSQSQKSEVAEYDIFSIIF